MANLNLSNDQIWDQFGGLSGIVERYASGTMSRDDAIAYLNKLGVSSQWINEALANNPPATAQMAAPQTVQEIVAAWQGGRFGPVGSNEARTAAQLALAQTYKTTMGIDANTAVDRAIRNFDAMAGGDVGLGGGAPPAGPSQPSAPTRALSAAGGMGLLGGGGLGTPAGTGGDIPLGVGNLGNEKFVPFGVGNLGSGKFVPFAGGAALDTSGVAPSLGGLGSRSFESQPLQDMFRRVGEELYGPRTPLQAGIMDDLIEKYGQFSPITQAGLTDFTDDKRANAFRQFLNSPLPSGIELGGRLANILGRQSEPQFSTFVSDLENERAQPKSFERIAEGALNVGTTPFLERLSPFVRSRAARSLEEQFRQMFARDPTRFQSPQDVFNELQRRGFIPSYAAGTPSLQGGVR